MHLGENRGAHNADNVSFKCYWCNAKLNMTEKNVLYKYLKYSLQKSTNILMTNLNALRQ